VVYFAPFWCNWGARGAGEYVARKYSVPNVKGTRSRNPHSCVRGSANAPGQSRRCDFARILPISAFRNSSGGGLNFITNNSMRCECCARTRAAGSAQREQEAQSLETAL
jgi:hypothetical protein